MTASLSGCNILYALSSPKIPEYGAVQTDFCTADNGMYRSMPGDFSIDVAFKNAQYDKDNFMADVYFGCTDLLSQRRNKYLSVWIMAIECNCEEPLKAVKPGTKPYILLHLEDTFSMEQYAEKLAEETIELKVNENDSKTFCRQVLFEIPWEEICSNDKYKIEIDWSGRYKKEIKYNYHSEISLSDKLLQEGGDRSILFVAFAVSESFSEQDMWTLSSLGYVRAKYSLSNNTVTLG